MFEEDWARELLIVLATAGVLVPLLARLRVGVVPGFLIAGMLLGPFGLGRFDDELPWLAWVTFTDPEDIEPFAELGVVFLLFVIGLEFSLTRLWTMRRLVFGVGSAQFFFSTAVIAGAVFMLHQGFDDSLVIGLALALSSTAIVTQVLIEAHRFATPVGRLSLGVLIFQDLMVVPIVLIIGLLAGEELAVPRAILRAIVVGAIVLAVIVIAGRYLVRPLLKLAAASNSRELMVAAPLFLAILTAALTEAIGLSSALGAFLAGLLLSESEYRHQLEVDIEPFKGLLLGLFFMTVGMALDLTVIAASPLPFLAALLGLIVVKTAVAFSVARAIAVPTPASMEAAFALAGGGEFALVAFALAQREQLMEPSVHQFVVSVAALSMLTIPVLALIGRRLAAVAARRLAEKNLGVDGVDTDSLADHVVIGGFGRVGQTMARVLDAEQVPYIAVDLDAELVEQQRKAGRPVFYGDACRREILEKVGGEAARTFVITTDDPEAGELMARAILSHWPEATIHARALDSDHARRLAEIGVTNAVPEALEASLQLAGRVLVGIGLPDDAVDARLSVARDAEVRQFSPGRP
jgi:monovalent cation:proton antiporter-2 (CPA2) family protein